jgi:hypothetical protein
MRERETSRENISMKIIVAFNFLPGYLAVYKIQSNLIPYQITPIQFQSQKANGFGFVGAIGCFLMGYTQLWLLNICKRPS